MKRPLARSASSFVYPPTTYFLRVFFILFFLTKYSFTLDWNSDIVASPDELSASKEDALSKYFGGDGATSPLFRTFEEMQKRVGEFMDIFRQRNHNYEDMTKWLKSLNTKFSSITHLHSIGKSVQGRELWVFIISSNPKEHTLLRPEFKYVANMHGNEPSMNPDGYEMDRPGDRVGYLGRANANNVDLNRNFPARYPSHKEFTGGTYPQPETEAVMKWILSQPFVLSANLHGGIFYLDFLKIICRLFSSKLSL